MTRLHHATRKKIERFGHTIEQNDDFYRAGGFWHHDPKVLAQVIELSHQLSEYNGLLVEQANNPEPRFEVFARTKHNLIRILGPQAEVPDLYDVTEAAKAENIDPDNTARAWSPSDDADDDQGQDDEDEDQDGDQDQDNSREIVGAQYRERYRKHGGTCGDWLAKWLSSEFTVVRDGRHIFDHRAFRDLLERNGIDVTAKWAQEPDPMTNSWKGRFRMTGRQKLEKIAAEQGHIDTENGPIEVPEEELEYLYRRHPKAAKKAVESQE